jgi:hypothetical protein
MTEKWPSYEVAPEESVYALGVVSINYARFERTHVWMTAAVANMKEAHAAVICARTNASDRARLIETYLGQSEWPQEALWPAPGSEDTELGVLMELEVRHGETEVYP